MNSNKILDLISHYTAIKSTPWTTIAILATQCLKEKAWEQTHSSASDWLADAAGRTKFTLNTFRRQTRVIEFLELIIPREDQQALLERNLPFGPLEILMRIHNVDSEESKKLLSDVINGNITLQGIKEKYKNIHVSPNGRSAFAARSKHFEHEAIEYIKNNFNKFTESETENNRIIFDSKIKNFPYGRADLWAISGEYVDGFEVKLFGSDDNKFVLIRTIEQINFMSSFHRKLWVIYPLLDNPIESHESFIGELCEHLKLLDLSNVGVALLSDDLDVKPNILIKPKPNEHPLRYQLLRDFIPSSLYI